VGGEAPVTPVSSPDSSSLDLSYKPCDNILAPLPGNTESTFLKRHIFGEPCLPGDSTSLSPYLGPFPMAPITATCPKNGRSCSPLAVSGFAIPKCICPRNSRFLESRLSSWLLTMALSSLSDVRSAGPTHRGFGLRDFEMQRFRVHEIPDMPIPDFLRISNTRPKWMDGSG
jgi:hypothetical protein